MTTSPSSRPRSTTLRIPLPRDGGTPPPVPLSDDPRRELGKLPPETPLSDRVFLRTVTDGFGCWIFGGAVHSGGYGVVNMLGVLHYAHRVAYETLAGPVGTLHLDHLCRDRLCVRPDHLEPVTSAENSGRGAVARRYCQRGHELEGPNLYFRPDGKGRRCRACVRIRNAR